VAVQNRLRLVKNVAKTLLYTAVSDAGGALTPGGVADRAAFLARATVVELRIDRWTSS